MMKAIQIKPMCVAGPRAMMCLSTYPIVNVLVPFRGSTELEIVITSALVLILYHTHSLCVSLCEFRACGSYVGNGSATSINKYESAMRYEHVVIIMQRSHFLCHAE